MTSLPPVTDADWSKTASRRASVPQERGRGQQAADLRPVEHAIDLFGNGDKSRTVSHCLHVTDPQVRNNEAHADACRRRATQLVRCSWFTSVAIATDTGGLSPPSELLRSVGSVERGTVAEDE